MTQDDQGKDSTEAQRVKTLAGLVRPLEWQDFEGRGAKASAYYQANYLIQFWKSEGKFEVALSFPGYQTGYDGPRWHKTLEAAKVAAEADYTARVFAAINTDAIAALVGALQAISGKVSWEINPSNYLHREVCDLNADWCEVGNIADAALARLGVTE